MGKEGVPLTLGGPACRTLPAVPLSWFCLPVAGTSSSTCSNFTATFQVPALFGQADAMAHFLSSAPTTFSTIISASLDCTQAFNSTNKSSLFLPHFFLLKARLSYHQNHSQMTGFDGLTRHVSNYLLGDKSETAWLKWKCTFAQVRRAPTGCGHVFMGLPALPPVPSAVRRHVPVPLVRLPQDLPNRQVVSVHKDGQRNKPAYTLVCVQIETATGKQARNGLPSFIH